MPGIHPDTSFDANSEFGLAATLSRGISAPASGEGEPVHRPDILISFHEALAPNLRFQNSNGELLIRSCPHPQRRANMRSALREGYEKGERHATISTCSRCANRNHTIFDQYEGPEKTASLEGKFTRFSNLVFSSLNVRANSRGFRGAFSRPVSKQRLSWRRERNWDPTFSRPPYGRDSRTAGRRG